MIAVSGERGMQIVIQSKCGTDLSVDLQRVRECV